MYKSKVKHKKTAQYAINAVPTNTTDALSALPYEQGACIK